MSDERREPPAFAGMTAMVSALGMAQIVSWGTLFYAIGVLGKPMREALGVSEVFVFSCFTAGLAVSGLMAPMAGRMIDARGGRVVLSMGSVVAAASMATLALAHHPAVMAVGWLLAGAAMAMCLYDPAFATLGQHTGARYRRAVTALTLFGGFASTVFWPLSHLLDEAWGWRVTWGLYAGFHLFVCLPIHLFFVPRFVPHAKAEASAGQADARLAGGDPRLRWLALSFAIATFIFGVIAVHLINLLTTAGLTTAQAVTISMLVGPLQVAGRVVEMGLSHRVRAVTVGMVSFALMLLALLALVNVEGFGIAAIVFVVAYGCGNGVLTIVKGTAPVELFGRERLGALLSYISRAGLFAKASAPAAFPALIAIGLSHGAALSALAVVALGGMGSYAMAIRRRD